MIRLDLTDAQATALTEAADRGVNDLEIHPQDEDAGRYARDAAAAIRQIDRAVEQSAG
jgi:hypothetical protein